MSEMASEPRNKPEMVLKAVLWLATVVLGVLAMVTARSVALRTYVRFVPADIENMAIGRGGVTMVNYAVVFPGAILLIAVIIGGVEYHFRHASPEDSWRVFTITLSLEIAVLALALFI